MTLAISIALAVVFLLAMLALREASREAESSLPLKPAHRQSRSTRARVDLAPRKAPASTRPAAESGNKKAL